MTPKRPNVPGDRQRAYDRERMVGASVTVELSAGEAAALARAAFAVEGALEEELDSARRKLRDAIRAAR